jgi:hypothetical protein
MVRRLFAGGGWIRTIGSTARRDRPFRDHLGPPRASLPPREATYLARGTWGLNPVCSSGASSKPRRQRLETRGVYDALAWNADVTWPEQPLGASRLRYTCPMSAGFRPHQTSARSRAASSNKEDPDRRTTLGSHFHADIDTHQSGNIAELFTANMTEKRQRPK